MRKKIAHLKGIQVIMKRLSFSRTFFLCVILAACLLSACSDSTSQLDFRFNDVDPESAAAFSPNDTKPLRVAIAAVISPKGNVESYGDLLNYLGRKLNRPIELVQRQT
jgi:phosphonate transport system substrate-binding protein